MTALEVVSQPIFTDGEMKVKRLTSYQYHKVSLVQTFEKYFNLLPWKMSHADFLNDSCIVNIVPLDFFFFISFLFSCKMLQHGSFFVCFVFSFILMFSRTLGLPWWLKQIKGLIWSKSLKANEMILLSSY